MFVILCLEKMLFTKFKFKDCNKNFNYYINLVNTNIFLCLHELHDNKLQLDLLQKKKSYTINNTSTQ